MRAWPGSRVPSANFHRPRSQAYVTNYVAEIVKPGAQAPFFTILELLRTYSSAEQFAVPVTNVK